MDKGQLLSYEQFELQDHARKVYRNRLENGVAREQARMDLPLSTYTEAYWKIDLHNLLHFLELRMDSHAQEEIRQYATVIGTEIVKLWVPDTWQAFMDYRSEAITLTKDDQSFLAAIISKNEDQIAEIEKRMGKRESRESLEKLAKLLPK